MQLNELFNSSIKYELLANKPDYWNAKYTLSTGQDLVIAARNELPEMYNIWDIIFSVDNNLSLTGSGNEFEVFAAVTAMLRDFVKTVKPLQVSMSAEESNRAKLYARMLKRCLPGWKVINFFEKTNNTNIVAAVNAEQFPVKRWKDVYGVGLASFTILGYKAGGAESSMLSSTVNLGDQLKDELAKAKELSLREE